MTRLAVVGHVEWVDFVRVEGFPEPGEIVHSSGTWEDAAGGGAVAAVELARLGAEVTFLTALGDDARGAASRARLEALGVEVRAAVRADTPQRRGVTLLDPSGERTIVVIGERMVPRGADELGWEDLAEMDAVYLTGGDPAAVRAARAARSLVATVRAHDALREAAVALDALVLSDDDPDEARAADSLGAEPRAKVRTRGAHGGHWIAGGEQADWAAAEAPAPRADTYGCGDCFAAGLTFGLGERLPLAEAIAVGARSGADCLTRNGPYPAAAGTARSVSSGA